MQALVQDFVTQKKINFSVKSQTENFGLNFCKLQDKFLDGKYISAVLSGYLSDYIIGASLSEPHTSESNGGFFIYYYY